MYHPGAIPQAIAHTGAIPPEPYGRNNIHNRNLFKAPSTQNYKRSKMGIWWRNNKQMNVLYCIISKGRLKQAEWK